MPLKRKKQPSEALKCVRVRKVTLKREKRILGLFSSWHLSRENQNPIEAGIGRLRVRRNGCGQSLQPNFFLWLQNSFLQKTLATKTQKNLANLQHK